MNTPPTPETIAAVLAHIAQLKLEAAGKDPHPGYGIDSFTPVCCSACGKVTVIQHSDVPVQNTGQLLTVLTRLIIHRDGCVVRTIPNCLVSAEIAVILRPVQ